MSQIDDQDLGRIANEYGVATAADLLAVLGQATLRTPDTNKLRRVMQTSEMPTLETRPSRPGLLSRCPTRCGSCTSRARITAG
jgi:hypothetical protein